MEEYKKEQQKEFFKLIREKRYGNLEDVLPALKNIVEGKTEGVSGKGTGEAPQGKEVDHLTIEKKQRADHVTPDQGKVTEAAIKYRFPSRR